ncbi:MAG: hypothetical protein OXI81_00200 [Paracoccaceae bacterium]|nr:hypothetical protein [Paracoccaceae bacterium]
MIEEFGSGNYHDIPAWANLKLRLILWFAEVLGMPVSLTPKVHDAIVMDARKQLLLGSNIEFFNISPIVKAVCLVVDRIPYSVLKGENTFLKWRIR